MFLLTFLLLQSSEYWIANGPIIVFVCVLLVTVTLCVWWRDVVPVRIWRELKETPDYLTVLSCTATIHHPTQPAVRCARASDYLIIISQPTPSLPHHCSQPSFTTF